MNPDGSVADANGDGLVNETDRVLLLPTDLVERAHDHGLLIHTWTFRNEQRRLASDFGGNPVNEYLLFYELGVDGLFSDFPTPHSPHGSYSAWTTDRRPAALPGCLVTGTLGARRRLDLPLRPQGSSTPVSRTGPSV